MSDTLSFSQSDSYDSKQIAHSGWHLFNQALTKAHIKQNSHQWYARHARRFLDFFEDYETSTLTHQQIESHFETIPQSWFRQDWQQAQYIDAVRILLSDVFKLPWARSFPWGQAISATKTLTPHHHTLAREAIKFKETEPEFSTELTSAHRNSLQLLTRSLRENHYAIRTEQTYLHWVQRFLLSIDTKTSQSMGDQQVKDFLGNLVIRRNVSKSTQNIALNALVYYFKHVVNHPLGEFEHIRSSRPHKLPTVLTRDQLNTLFRAMAGLHLLMAELMYGTGLRLIECVRLRVKDIDLTQCQCGSVSACPR